MTPSPLCNFDVVNYTSEVLWHFVREDGVTCFLNKILQSDGRILLKKDPGLKIYDKRKITIVHKGIDNKEDDEEILFAEPKALCFADIPINFLPIHMGNYGSSLGIGINKFASRCKYNIRPVDYYPLTTSDDIHEHWLKFVKEHRCKLQDDTYILDDYTKIPSDGESFDKIYMEREWRMTSDLVINATEDILRLLVVAKREDYYKIIENEHVRKLMANGVSILISENIFPSVEGK